MTAAEAHAIRRATPDKHPIALQYEAWELEALRLEDLLRRNEIKSTADWHLLQTAQRMRASLAEDLMTAA